MKKFISDSMVLKFMGAIVLLILSLFIALLFGAKETTIYDLWQAITTNASSENVLVLREIRFPREFAALAIGAAFAVSGAIMQGVTRNPLADPGLLGLTSDANMALAMAFALKPEISYFGIMLACFAGAAFGGVLVLLLSSLRRGSLSPFRVILAGAAVSSMLYSIATGISLTFKISKDVSMWTAGGLIGTNWDHLRIIMPFMLVALLIAFLYANQINILGLGDEVSIGLGQKTFTTKAILFLLVIVLTGAAVALVGNMAFVGLMIPHIVRRLVGTDYRMVLPFSALAGAIFMVLADTIGRTIHSPYETPVAAIVAMAGLPFFLFVVHKGGKSLS